MITKTLASIDDLTEIVKDYFREKWIFRGVEDADYKLRPKIGRDGARKDPATGANLSYSSTDEQHMVNQFIRESKPLVPVMPSLQYDWMAIAQHHGMPTRLLDWTESPFVACYFAVKTSGLPHGAGGPKKDAALYAVEPPKHMTGTSGFVGFGPDTALLRPSHLTRRITAQRGLFTIHAHPDQDWDPPSLIKWTIPAAGCFTLKRMLDFCGINEASLFPDLDGLAQHLGFRYKWTMLDKLV